MPQRSPWWRFQERQDSSQASFEAEMRKQADEILARPNARYPNEMLNPRVVSREEARIIAQAYPSKPTPFEQRGAIHEPLETAGRVVARGAELAARPFQVAGAITGAVAPPLIAPMSPFLAKTLASRQRGGEVAGLFGEAIKGKISPRGLAGRLIEVQEKKPLLQQAISELPASLIPPIGTAKAGVTGVRAVGRAIPQVMVRAPSRTLQEAGLRLAGAKGVAGGVSRPVSRLEKADLTRQIKKAEQQLEITKAKVADGSWREEALAKDLQDLARLREVRARMDIGISFEEAWRPSQPTAPKPVAPVAEAVPRANVTEEANPWAKLSDEERAVIERDLAPRGRSRRVTKPLPPEDPVIAQLRALSPTARSAEAVVAKERWAMTREEYFADYVAQRPNVQADIRAGRDVRHGMEQVRKFEVRQAIAEGKPVPPEVLADYPDLTPRQPRVVKPTAEVPGARPAVTKESVFGMDAGDSFTTFPQGPGLTARPVRGVIEGFLVRRSTDGMPNRTLSEIIYRSKGGKQLIVGVGQIDVITPRILPKAEVPGGQVTSPGASGAAAERAATLHGVGEPLTEAPPPTRTVPVTARRVRAGQRLEQTLQESEEALRRREAQAPRETPAVVPPSAAVTPPGDTVPPKIIGSAAGSADVPPRVPRRPRRRPTEGETPIPESIQRALDIGDAIVKRDKPGIIKRTMSLIPGLKQVGRKFQPAIDMPDNVLSAHIANGNVQNLVAQDMARVRIPVIKRLDATFGDAVVRGRDKSAIRFLGTADEAEYPATGMMFDIAQNPHLYDLSVEQANLLRQVSDELSTAFDRVVAEYGLDIGKFPVKPGSVFLSNIEKPQAGKGLFQDIIRTAKSGRAKTRFYETGRARWMHDPTFNPVMDVEQLLGNEMHGAMAGMAGKTVYKTGIGGLGRMGALKVTGHEGLVNKMVGLRNRVNSLRSYKAMLSKEQAEAIDNFLVSPLEDTDLIALRNDLEPALKAGRYVAKSEAGKGIAELTREIEHVRAEIKVLQPAWKAANAKGYTFVQDGVFRYFPDDVAQHIVRLNKMDDNRLVRFVDDLRATAFSGDLSPISIQGSVGWLADPVGMSQDITSQLSGGIKSGRGFFGMFTEVQMVQDIAENADSWTRFTEATGINALGTVDREFSVGLIGKIPGVGKRWTEFNESVYRPLLKSTKRIFDSSYDAAIAEGFSESQAMAIAGDDATKLIPRLNFRRLGLSQAEYANYRALLTSISFVTQPTAMAVDATKALVKLGLFKPGLVTRNEQFALKRVMTLIATAEALAVSSSVYYAVQHNQDPAQAAKDALNPTHANFMSIKTPWGARIGIGGPFRSLIKMVVPRKIEGVDFPVPFAGFHRWATSKIGPAPRIVYDEIRNVDFYGKRIRTGDFPINILQGVGYAATGVAPLTIGSSIRGAMKGEGVGRTLEEIVSQFGGTNYIPFDAVYDAKLRWQDSVQEYNDTPTDTLKLQRGQLTRLEYRDKHPDVDAKLFIQGDVTGLRTIRAVREAARLIHENDIDPREVRGIKLRKKTQEEYRKAGKRLERNEVDRLIDALESAPTTPATPTAPQPATPAAPSGVDSWERFREPAQATPTPSATGWERFREPVGAGR